MESKTAFLRVLFCLCFFMMSGTENAEKTTKGSTKVEYQEKQEVFGFPSSAMGVQRDIPVVNPTTPGTTPIVNPTSPIPPTTMGTSGGSWCIANPSASQTALQVALDYACGYGGTDCSAIQPNALCWDPNTVADHASYAFNDYYQKNPVPTSCVFGGAAQLTTTDPSHGNCRFAAPTTTLTTPPVMPTTPPATPMVEPPPSPIMPTNPYAPGGDTGTGTEPTDGDYGVEPTGEPSSAQTATNNLALLLIITIFCLVMPPAIASHA